MNWRTGNDGGSSSEWARDHLAPSLMRSWPDEAATQDPDWWDQPQVSLWYPAPGACVAVPEHFTPGYAYPLLIWLCDAGEPDAEIGDWLEQISPRNFVAMGLRSELYGRGTAPAENRVAGAALTTMLNRFAAVLRRVESCVNVHRDRRYVAGAGGNGRTAIEWLLRRPEWFAGGIAIDAATSSPSIWRSRSAGLFGRRLLWIHMEPPVAAAPDVEALRCLGLDVDDWRPAAGSGWPHVAEKINHWVLSAIPTAVCE